MRALFILIIAACTTTPPNSSWRVDDGFLHAPDGRVAILRGVNLSGTQKNAPYIDGKSFDDYARIHDSWGFDSIRFIMTWAAIEPTQGTYDDAYLDQVVERMEWAHQAGLAVILDMHEDIYGEGFGYDGAPAWTCDASNYTAFVNMQPWYINSLSPQVEACVDQFYTTATRGEFIAAWQHVAERLANSPAVIGIDPLNEPSWGTYPVFNFERDRLVPLYNDIATTVRAIAPQWIIFAEPSSSRNIGLESEITSLPFDNAMYAPHSYDSGAESGSGFDPSHTQQILANGTLLAQEATTMHAGLWIGEYGGESSEPGIADYMTAEYDAAAAYAAGTTYWADDNGGYGLTDANDQEVPEIVDAVVRPYPAFVAGTPSSYAYDASSMAFTLTYAPDRSSTLPTEIAIPPRLYPNGYSVDCGGCTWHAELGAASIDTPPPGDTATITVE
ncbi:MAG TPA: cellulase family glycosylhydrolase [Kofleriaceae bacterium]|jgi:endoglycosylceramidase